MTIFLFTRFSFHPDLHKIHSVAKFAFLELFKVAIIYLNGLSVNEH